MVLVALFVVVYGSNNESCGVGESVGISMDLGCGVMLLLYDGISSSDRLGRNGFGGGYVGIMGLFGWGYGVDSALLRALYPKIIRTSNIWSVTIHLHINYIDIMA